jgi:outer membrane receptor protein involved in Fe transport
MKRRAVKAFNYCCIISIALITTFLPLHIRAQNQFGKIAGKVLNNKNEPLGGVSIKVKGNKGGTQSNLDGNYILSVEAGKKLAVVFTYVGYEEKEIADVEVANSQVANLDVTMNLKNTTSLNDVVVRGQARTAKMETVNSAIQFQKNTSVVASVISAEAIRRSPDRNSSEVLKRVPGTSIQDGKYLVVRGLADRYNQAMLNGILLSSTEPDRKTFSFDIFPAPMIDNIVVNKSFVPELPGEWAGGLVQITTKDIPAANFFNIQIGTGFNSNTIGKDFYSNSGGKYDWLGFDDGKRGLPATMPLRADFLALQPYPGVQAQHGTTFQNSWDVEKSNVPLSASFQMSGGFNKSFSGTKKLGAVLALTYLKMNKRLPYTNAFYSVDDQRADVLFSYSNNKYSEDVLWGALGNITLQLNNNNKISFKNVFNVNSTDYSNLRTGLDYEFDSENGANIRAREIAFKSNTYFNTQLTGEHNIGGSANGLKLKWYGAFNILDQYIPDQRRVQYNQSRVTPNEPYYLLISGTLSQKSGSRFYQNLNDYVYTAGDDLSKSFNAFGEKQTLKGGYFFQVKDRLFDSRPFSVFLQQDNPSLRLLPEGEVFDAANFGVDGETNKFGFGEIGSNKYRYLANSILNAGYLQLDNSFGEKFRLVWGARIEDFDQLIGSVKKSDDRFVNNKKTDILPGANLTYKLNSKTNIRLSGSQTVIRPEFRELAPFAFYDFELGATIIGNPNLVRTKVTNADLRYELYPRAGEIFAVGFFYKYFKNPIELYFNQSGVATNTFNFLNADHATGYGIELEFRKKLDFVNLLRNFTIQGNLSYIKNNVEDNITKISRPMQGQSPYLINVGLQYDIEKAGISTTLLFNEIGRRILYVGNDQVPAIWENPRPLLDFQITKKLLKNKAEIKLNVQDILNKPAYFYHDIDANSKFGKTTDAIAITRNYGTNVGISFAYTIK